jgi:hypothetical protein
MFVTSESVIFAICVPTSPHPTTIHVSFLNFVQQMFHDPVYSNINVIVDSEYFLRDL